MIDCSMQEILASREERVKRQKELLEKYQCPVISFTMNIAGPQKTSPKIKRAFIYGLCLLYEKLEKMPIKHREIIDEKTGDEALFSVDAPAKRLKEICVSIEEAAPLGRLFDMDVIDADGKKLEREAQNERACMICGKKSRACAASRAHSVEELQGATNEMITDFFVEEDAKRLAALARESLIDEVNTTVKPGLVDKRNSGSHNDMTIESFYKSADALENYFYLCVKLGHQSKKLSLDKGFSLLREAGKTAEKQMYEATYGVNTHKGAIFSYGVMLGAIGMLWTVEKPVARLNKIFIQCKKIAGVAYENDFSSDDDSTAGKRLYKSLGITGIRGEAAGGFQSLMKISIPAMIRAKQSGASSDDVGIYTLLNLIASVDDTNLYNRGGIDGANYAKEYAKRVLDEHIFPSREIMEKMDDDFIERRLSPGGSADLLALTYFCCKLQDIKIKGLKTKGRK